MDIFFTVLLKLIPLYVIILLGFIGGKYLNVKKDVIASLTLYLIVPIVVFNGAVTTKINLSTLSVPLLFTIIASFICIISYYIAGLFWKDSNRNILAFAAGSSNTGYFGLPVAIALFGNSAIGIAALVVLGTTIYSNTIGFFTLAKGKHTARESLIKLAKLPILYAFFLGVLVSVSGIHLGQIYTDNIGNFNGAYVVLGMMLIGIALADLKEYKFDFKFIGFSLFTTFVLWPLIMLAIIFIDSQTFKLYNPNLYKIFILMAILPMAVNNVSYATLLKVQPEKVSLAVFISTIFALFYIPLIAVYFLR